MARGVKQKGKGKQAGDEHKPTKTTSNDASKKADKNKYAVEREEDPEPLFENRDNGPVSPALMTRAMHGEQYTTWKPPPDDRDAGGGGNGWGGTARSWVPDTDWDPVTSHSTQDVPPVPAKSPAPYPLNNFPLGTIPENRYSSSMRSAGAHEHQDEYGQGHEYHEYQNQGQDRNDHDWNNIPNTVHQTTQTATTTAVPSMRAPSPTHRDMDIPLSALNTSMALAEHNKRPLKYSSASAAAKKVESNTAPANRNSFWSQTHQIAAAKNGIFLPQPEGKGGGKGPYVFDTPPVGAMRAAPVDEMNTIPAWMQWGDPHRNKPPSRARHGHPAGHPQQQHPAHPRSRAAPAHRKASPSWQKWGKMASAHDRYIPPSDSSEDEEEWEEDHGDWGGAGQGWGKPVHSQRGGNLHQARDHEGAHRGRPTFGAHGWGQAGDARGRPKSGGSGWGHAGGSGGGGGGGGGGWGSVGRGKGASAPNSWDPMGTTTGEAGAWGSAPEHAGAAWGGGGGGGTWENASTLNGGYDDGNGWGNHGAGDAAHGWEAAPGTSKVNLSASAEDAMVGSRNALSPRERTQILNNLLNGATAEQKPKTKSKQQHDAGDGWGMPARVLVDDGWEGGGKGNEKEKETKKKKKWGMWGSGRAPQDDGWGAPARGKSKIKKKKKQEDHEGWGAPAEDPHVKKKEKGNHQDDWGWGGEGEEHPEDDWGIPKGGAKNQDQGAWGGGGAWGDEHDDDGDDEHDDGWGGGKGERSWAAWETGAEQEGGKQSKAKKIKGDDPYAAWGTSGQDGWGDDDKENDHRVRFAGRESAAWGSQAGTAHGIPSKTMLHASMGIANSAHNTSAPQLLGGPKLLESNGAAFKGVQSAFYSLNRPARERFHWMFPPQNDPRVMAILAWLQHAAQVVGTVGLQKFLQSRERGALFVNATFRLPDDPDQPVFDWLTFDKLQPTMDKTLQESTAFYDPASLVIVFVYLSSPSGNSVAIWRRKIRVPPVASTMLQKEIGLIKMGLRPENEYIVFLEEMPPKRAHKGRPASKTPHTPIVQAGPAAKTTVVIKQAHQPSTAATIVKQAANAQVPVRTANVSSKGKFEVKKIETKKKRKWWQFFK